MFVVVGCQATATANQTPGLNSFKMSVAEERLRIDFVTTALQFDTGLLVCYSKTSEFELRQKPRTPLRAESTFSWTSVFPLFFNKRFQTARRWDSRAGAPIPDVVTGVLPLCSTKNRKH